MKPMLFIKDKYPQILLNFVLLFSAVSVQPADLMGVTVEFENEHYYLTSHAWLDAPKEELYRVLTDYDLFVKISSGFVESRNVEANGDGKPRFYTRMQGCVLIFCKSFERYGYLDLDPQSEIIAIVEPEESDFDYSVESWRLSSDGEGTHVQKTSLRICSGSTPRCSSPSCSAAMNPIGPHR